jgi:hypothetical protein
MSVIKGTFLPKPLDGSRGKAAWGKSHCDRLKADILIWKYLQREPPFSLRKEFQADLNRFVVSVESPWKLPLSWSLMIGDSLNNYRSALDHLAWFLVQLNPPSGLREIDVMFPVYDPEPKFEANVARRLPGVDRKLIDIIKKYQPFVTSDAAKAITTLVEFNNFDKHREVRPVIGQSVGDIHFEVTEATHFTVTKTVAPQDLNVFLEFKPGAELAYIYGTPSGDGKPEVKMKFVGSQQITFEDGRGVVDALDAIDTAVLAVIDEIEALL